MHMFKKKETVSIGFAAITLFVFRYLVQLHIFLGISGRI